MSKQKEEKSLSWDDFIKLGNPENAPDEVEDKNEFNPASQHLRIHLDRKQRRGKEVTLVTGWTADEEGLLSLGKLLKSKCGGGGTIKDNEILIQGNHRDKILQILIEQGYKNAKKAGG
jgi:translation initiation factor 1